MQVDVIAFGMCEELGSTFNERDGGGSIVPEIDVQ
jgi:hypothetical protein